MLVSDFDFELPSELIAQQAPSRRGSSRMLALDRGNGAWRDLTFENLPQLLREGDVLVLNDSRVIPARLFAMHRDRSDGGKIEVMLTEQVNEWEWLALTRPARRVRMGDSLLFSAPNHEVELEATVTALGEDGARRIRFSPAPDFFARLDQLGHIPLPPYIRREKDAPDNPQDRERYQTVFARERGSVAAPTAGLHFTPEILDQITQRGVTVRYVTLHVGLGTFQPVRVNAVDEIVLHAERYSLPEETARTITQAVAECRRVVAVGTTTVRVLEHCARIGKLEAHSGTTSIFLSPGYRFQAVSALLTNFHLPQSTLLMLVSAFAGTEHTLHAYRHAVEARYRFFSFGDCMFIS